MTTWLVFGAAFLVAAYFLFRDTMNRIQYIQFLRLYWITRNNATTGTPVVAPGFMRQTAAPWWQGRGIQFRAGKYTFQIGILLRRADSLLDQVGGRDMDADAKEIRSW